MSGALSREVDAVQNAALAAVLLWRFCVTYATTRQTPSSTPVPVLFVVLPLLFDEDTASLVASTKKSSGLRLFAGKFTESTHAKADVPPLAGEAGPRTSRANAGGTKPCIEGETSVPRTVGRRGDCALRGGAAIIARIGPSPGPKCGKTWNVVWKPLVVRTLDNSSRHLLSRSDAFPH